MIYEVKELKKVYKSYGKGVEIEALKGVSFEVSEGEFLAIMGESGSGKTTLLNILALLDRPTQGEVSLMEKNLNEISDRDSAEFRRDNIGYVFQNYNLLDNFTVRDNILLPLVLKEEKVEFMELRLKEVAERLGLSEKVDKYPYELSGGEKQRTALARAIIVNTKIILADEPTGALDSSSADSLLEYFVKLNNSYETILMVTHSIKAASYAKRIIFLKDGRIFNQVYREGRSQSELYEIISNTMAQLSGAIR